MTGVTFLMVMGWPWRSESVVLLAGVCEDAVVVRSPHLRDRLLVRLRAGCLDRALAKGTPPEASAALALRARRLTEPPLRRAIAEAFRRVVQEAPQAGTPLVGRVAPDRARVASASEELSLLADALASPGPVAARGVAQARLLLTDGTGPLYNPLSRATLGGLAARAADQLRPWRG